MAKCIECGDVMKTGILVQMTPKGSMDWVCKTCFDEHDYASVVKKKIIRCEDVPNA